MSKVEKIARLIAEACWKKKTGFCFESLIGETEISRAFKSMSKNSYSKCLARAESIIIFGLGE